MKPLLKILLFILTVFQTNICESKVFVSEVISEIAYPNVFNSKKSSAELETIFSENDLANTYKSQSNLVDYINWAISSKANAT